MVLFILINPSYEFPYCNEMEEHNVQSVSEARDVLKKLMEENKTPEHSAEYKTLHDNQWSMVKAAYEACTFFQPGQRASTQDLLKLLACTKEDCNKTANMTKDNCLTTPTAGDLKQSQGKEISYQEPDTDRGALYNIVDIRSSDSSTTSKMDVILDENIGETNQSKEFQMSEGNIKDTAPKDGQDETGLSNVIEVHPRNIETDGQCINSEVQWSSDAENSNDKVEPSGEAYKGDSMTPVFSWTKRAYTAEQLTYILLEKYNEEHLCISQPVNVSNNVSFLVELSCLRHPDDLKCDDMGSWKHNGSPRDWFSVTKGTKGFEILLNSIKFSVSKCYDCGGNIENPPQALPDDLIIVYRDIREYRDRMTGQLQRSATAQNVYFHLRASCILQRYPTFHPGLLDIDMEFVREFRPEHSERLFYEFGWTNNY